MEDAVNPMDWACAIIAVVLMTEGVIMYAIDQLREAHRDHLEYKYGSTVEEEEGEEEDDEASRDRE